MKYSGNIQPMERRFNNLVEEAFSKPGAILIRNDPSNFKDASTSSYQFGTQQEKHPKRFLNLFWVENYPPMMYFKHEREEIQTWYAAYPQAILPSEIAGNHWSKAVIAETIPDSLLSSLLNTSYRLVCQSLPKKGQRLLEAIQVEENSFKDFHALALAVSHIKDVSFVYTDGYSMPMITFQGLPLVRFYFNNLLISLPVAQLRALVKNDWLVKEPPHGQGWAVVHGTAKHQWKEWVLKVIEHKSNNVA